MALAFTLTAIYFMGVSMVLQVLGFGETPGIDLPENPDAPDLEPGDEQNDGSIFQFLGPAGGVGFVIRLFLPVTRLADVAGVDGIVEWVGSLLGLFFQFLSFQIDGIPPAFNLVFMLMGVFIFWLGVKLGRGI